MTLVWQVSVYFQGKHWKPRVTQTSNAHNFFQNAKAVALYESATYKITRFLVYLPVSPELKQMIMPENLPIVKDAMDLSMELTFSRVRCACYIFMRFLTNVLVRKGLMQSSFSGL